MATNYYDSFRPSLQIQPDSYSPPMTIISLDFISFAIKQIHESKLGLLNLVSEGGKSKSYIGAKRPGFKGEKS